MGQSELDHIQRRLRALVAARLATGLSVDELDEYRDLCRRENELLGLRSDDEPIELEPRLVVLDDYATYKDREQ